MSIGEFADATKVASFGEDRWVGTIEPRWDIAGNANGGYLLAIATRALKEGAERAQPVSVTGHFLAPGRPGPVTVSTNVLKRGRQLATGTAVLSDSSRPLLVVVGSFGDLGPESEVRLIRSSPPELPPLDDCIAMDSSEGFAPPFFSKVDLRLHPEDAQFALGNPSGTPQIRGWIRLRDDELVDGVALTCLADATPPTIFNAGLPLGWTPTVELTVHVRALPVPGWLRVAFETRFVANGRLEVDGVLYDEAGTLVAQSRQLALVPQG